MQEVAELPHVATFVEGLGLVVADGLAVRLVLGTMENEVDAKLLFHQGAEFVFVGGHVAVLLQDGTELSTSLLIRLEGLQVRLDGGHRQGVDDVAVALDAETVILLVALIAAGFEDGLELVDGGEAVIQGFLHGIGCPLLLVLAHNAVDDFLRADAFLIMINLVAIGSDTTGDDVQMIVVGVVVSIDQNRLVGVAIAHFIEVFVGYLQKLLMGIFVSSAGNGEVELGFLDAIIILISVIDERLFQLFGCIVLVNEVETFHLQKLGNTL